MKKCYHYSLWIINYPQVEDRKFQFFCFKICSSELSQRMVLTVSLYSPFSEKALTPLFFNYSA